MVITDKIRKKLTSLLPPNYRQIIAEREGCHPNTVYNVLHNGSDNLDVALALLELGQEQKSKSQDREKKKQTAQSIAEQL